MIVCVMRLYGYPDASSLGGVRFLVNGFQMKYLVWTGESASCCATVALFIGGWGNAFGVVIFFFLTGIFSLSLLEGLSRDKRIVRNE